MKKIITTLAVLAVLALPVLAQTTQTPAGCTAESKQAWYNEFRQTFKTDQPKAYQLAQKYLACPAEAGEEQITAYLKNFITLIDKASRTPQVASLVYEKKDYAKAFELGRQVLTDEPDNVKVMADLSYAGYLAATSKVNTYNTDTLNYSKKAIQLIQSGTVPSSWAPYSGKDEALAYLNNTIGVLTISTNPTEALPYLLKAAQLEGKLKKQPITYGYIGDAYQSGPYDQLSAQYKANFEGKDETPESKLALENINQVIDRMIDAYARAVALSTDPAQAASKQAWMDTLTTWYKYRNNQSDAGLPNLIASVLNKPLPPVPTPITTLPAATPSSSPATGANSAAGNGTSAASTTPAGTPQSTTTTPKPKPRKHHGRN
ncbi:MAG TPA: hypothetical protein VJV03_09995 [Pyrinomonadaceae bacterium]|nr:hypothetical protein [Pyrinomonadaceae bacterium]